MDIKPEEKYDSSSIKILEGLEPVRLRPGMYIGSTDERGLHHMVQEIIDNAVDEALAGYANHITIILTKDGKVTIHDNGRGIPVDIHPKTGKSTLETIFTVLHAGGKFEKTAYKISGGLHGVGSSVVNALSIELEAVIHKYGKIHTQKYKRGIPEEDVKVIGETNRNGSIITFKPDPEIFETIEFNQNIILQSIKQAAYLTPGITFTFINENNNFLQRYYFEGGITTRLKTLVNRKETLSSAHHIQVESEKCRTEIVFQYVNTESVDNTIISFTNNIPTINGGTHVLGFKSALLKIINEIGKEKGKIHKKIGEFQYNDVLDGLYAIISVRIPEPQFEGQTKGRLGNSYVRKEVENLTYNYLKDYFQEHEDEFDRVFEKIELAARARLAAKFAKETILRKNILAGGVLPGKLSDCSQKKMEGTEMFIVEGDSAGGTAKQGRNSKIQAILPLRGKILNIENISIQKAIANNEIKSLITAIGTGIKESFNLETLRYDKIIIMTDADVDGAHIRTLLLTFFFRYMRPLIESGHLYIACPPIYKFKEGKKEMYVYEEDETPEDYGFNKDKTEVQRYKGLGEMNAEQLRATTMDPTTRKMYKVNSTNIEEIDKLFNILMGEDVQSRKHFILTNAKNITNLDV